jgi:hypothetical protein
MELNKMIRPILIAAAAALTFMSFAAPASASKALTPPRLPAPN